MASRKVKDFLSYSNLPLCLKNANNHPLLLKSIAVSSLRKKMILMKWTMIIALLKTRKKDEKR